MNEEFINCDKEDVNKAVRMVQLIFDKAANMSLKQRKPKNRQKKQPVCNKKWFDNECKKAIKELHQVSNLKHSDLSNLLLRQQYNSILKYFKTLLKTKKQDFQNEKLIELEKNHDNSEFWKILKSANEEIHEQQIP